MVSKFCSDCARHPGFAKLLAGSNVAIVGRSSALRGLAQGGSLDIDFDLVIRVNHLPSSRETADIGSRTDVLAYNFATSSLGRDLEDLRNNGLKSTAPLVVFPRLPHDRLPRHMQGEIAVANLSRELADHGLSVQIEEFSESYLESLYTKLGGYPTTGAMLIAICLGHEFKSLYVTGFDWYSSINPYLARVGFFEWLRHAKVAGHPLRAEVTALQDLHHSNAAAVSGDASYTRIIVERKYKGPNKLLALKTTIQNSLGAAAALISRKVPS